MGRGLKLKMEDTLLKGALGAFFAVSKKFIWILSLCAYIESYEREKHENKRGESGHRFFDMPEFFRRVRLGGV